jgi:hypothetical protein
MATSKQDLQNLARRLAELRREIELENAAFNATHRRILDMEKLCSQLAADIERAAKQLAAPAAPEKAIAPEPTPYAEAVEHVRAMRAEVEKEKEIEKKEEIEEIGVVQKPVAEKPTIEEFEEEVPVGPERGLHELFAKAPKEAGMDEAILGSISRLASRLESPTEPETELAPRQKVAEVRNLEAVIGSYWFSRLGAISLLVGFVIFAGYIQPYLTPAIRVGLCYLGAAVLCGIGLWAEKAYPKFSRPVLAAGLVLAFFTSFAGHFIRPMECFSLCASTVLMLVAAAAVVVVAGTLRSQPLGILALAMGFWVALFATKLTDAFTPAMLVFMSAAAVVLFVRLRWATLMILAVSGVYLCDVWWLMLGEKNWQGESLFWVEIEYLTAYFAVFLTGDVLGRLRNSKETLESAWPKVVAADQCVLAARFLNPIAYFLIGSYIYWDTKVFWDNIHYFYWPAGVVLAVVGFAGRRIEREATNEEDIFFVMASGLITLGAASAFEAMSLSNVLALEGLCLYAIRRITGRPIFQYLSVLHYALAFLQFNFVAFDNLTPVAVSDWKAFATGLPAMLFTLAPTFLSPLWGETERDRGTPHQSAKASLAPGIPEIGERELGHVRALAGSILLLRLFFQTVRPEVAFGLWVLLVPATLAVAWRWRRAPALWTLGGSLLAWAHLYFFPQLKKVEIGDPAWMFPAAIGLTLLTLAIGFLVETLPGGRIYERSEQESETSSNWAALTVVLISLAVADITALIENRADYLIRYPLAGALAVGLIVVAVSGRMAFPCLTGLFLLGVNSLFSMNRLFGGTTVSLPGLFMWTLVGTALAVAFARCFDSWAETLLRRAFDWFHHGTSAVVVLTAIVVVGVVSVAFRFAPQYATMGFLSVTVMTVFALALGLFAEKIAGFKDSESGEVSIEAKGLWVGLISVLILLSIVHGAVMLAQRAEPIHCYPYAAVFGVGLMALAYLTRMAFPCLTGLFLVGISSVMVLGSLVGPNVRLPGFFAWTLAGAALAVGFERCFFAWAKTILQRAFEWFRHGSVVVIALVTFVLLGLVHYTAWIGGRYETVGVTSAAIVLLGLGIVFRSALYRRFGLGVFLYALGRVYLIDLSGLETVYKITAFIVLGAVLIAVSYLYTRFKDQFQKWV